MQRLLAPIAAAALCLSVLAPGDGRAQPVQAWDTAPCASSTKRTSPLSNSIAPRLARARSSTLYSWCRRCTCGSSGPTLASAAAWSSSGMPSPTAFQTSV